MLSAPNVSPSTTSGIAMIEPYPRFSASARHGGERRVSGRVLDNLRLSRPDARPRRSQDAVAVGPSDVDRLQVAFVDARLRHGGHSLRLVVLRASDPAEAITRLVDDDSADLIEPGGLLGGADQAPRCSCSSARCARLIRSSSSCARLRSVMS